MEINELFERNKSWCTEMNNYHAGAGYFYKVVPTDVSYHMSFLNELWASTIPLAVECKDCIGKETKIVKVVHTINEGVIKYSFEDVDLS